MLEQPDPPAGDLVCLGLVGRELIRTPRGLIEGWGGAPLYFASAAAAAGRDASVITGLTDRDRDDLLAVLERASSTITLESLRTESPCQFDMTYGPYLELEHFSYSPGALGHDRAAMDWVRVTLVRTLETQLVDHLHVCPLPSSLMDVVAPAVLEGPVPFSLQAHFSEVVGSKDWLLRLMERASHVFMNRDEARAIFDVSDESQVGAAAASRVRGICFVTDPTGVSAYTAGRAMRFLASPVVAMDPTGAGDALAGGVLGRLLSGAGLRTSVNTGLALAGVTVSSASSTGIIPLAQAGRRLNGG